MEACGGPGSSAEGSALRLPALRMRSKGSQGWKLLSPQHLPRHTEVQAGPERPALGRCVTLRPTLI